MIRRDRAHYIRLVRSYGLKQDFITPRCPQQNGMAERPVEEQRAVEHAACTVEPVDDAATNVGDASMVAPAGRRTAASTDHLEVKRVPRRAISRVGQLFAAAGVIVGE